MNNKGLKITIVELLDDCNQWQWYQIYQSSFVGIEEAITLTIGDQYEKEDIPEKLTFIEEKDYQFETITYCKEDDTIRAFYYYI